MCLCLIALFAASHRFTGKNPSPRFLQKPVFRELLRMSLWGWRALFPSLWFPMLLIHGSSSEQCCVQITLDTLQLLKLLTATHILTSCKHTYFRSLVTFLSISETTGRYIWGNNQSFRIVSLFQNSAFPKNDAEVMHVACATAGASFELYFRSVTVPLPRQQCKPLWKWVGLEGDSVQKSYRQVRVGRP